MALILAVCVSWRKGTAKRPVRAAHCIARHGIRGDAHAGPGARQISLLNVADIWTMRAAGVQAAAGDFGENLVVLGLHVPSLRAGDLLRVIGGPLLQVTQIGKECHKKGCTIKRRAGYCIMPACGVFARVLRGGALRRGQRMWRRRAEAPVTIYNLPQAATSRRHLPCIAVSDAMPERSRGAEHPARPAR